MVKAVEKRFGTIALEMGFITEEQLEEAAKVQMDQDADGTPGEDPDDVYTGTFTIDRTDPADPGIENFTVTPEENDVTTTHFRNVGDRRSRQSTQVDFEHSQVGCRV